ncbi:MAG: hypothetical protein ACE5PV_17650 [Candidatus Poribacteria bacterium]
MEVQAHLEGKVEPDLLVLIDAEITPINWLVIRDIAQETTLSNMF